MKDIIVQDKAILSGKPIIAGTRMSVESILELLSSGMEMNDIVKEYPFLTKKQIQAAITYAANLLGREESYFFDKTKQTTHEVSGRR